MIKNMLVKRIEKTCIGFLILLLRLGKALIP